MLPFFTIIILLNFFVNSEKCSEIMVSSYLDPSLNSTLKSENKDNYINDDMPSINRYLTYLDINQFDDNEEQFRYVYNTGISWKCFSIEFMKKDNFTVTELGKSIPWDYCTCLNTCVVNMTFNMVLREFNIEDDAISISCLKYDVNNNNTNTIIAITASIVILLLLFAIGFFFRKSIINIANINSP